MRITGRYTCLHPLNDWSYYESNGLEVTNEMKTNAAWFQNHLKEINSNLSHPEEWVQVTMIQKETLTIIIS